ncbi:MAG: hypothetical protein FD165_2336 [Gammaproteobacteria bacterium]|nr:MAG: hypothetical protein FD165_2336 [Gammaproteobacteria bacterium]TND01445.1 MAG: hypothetical protein FD120_2618 [Gammaproteobacteria bacterium]
MGTVQTVDVYVLYFDVRGFVARFLSEGQHALDQLRGFQKAARAGFEFSRPHSLVVTLYDNVWARVNASQPGAPSLVLDYAGKVMSAAEEFGYPNFYGAVTRGLHDFDPDDRMLVAKESLEDITEQHMDMTSEPHIRAVLAEKCLKRHTELGNVVWVSSEVLGAESLDALLYPDSTFQARGDPVDLRHIVDTDSHGWSFTQSLFYPIRPRSPRGAQ